MTGRERVPQGGPVCVVRWPLSSSGRLPVVYGRPCGRLVVVLAVLAVFRWPASGPPNIVRRDGALTPCENAGTFRFSRYSHLFVEVTIRRARTSDVPAIRRLIDLYTPDGRLLAKSTVTLYEDLQEFWVGYDQGFGRVVGCGALHVMWEDLAEVRSVAVDPACSGRGIGHRIVNRLLETARELGVDRVFCLTFEVDSFARHGFRPIQGTPVSPEVYEELLRSYDEGVAEFLDLDRVKPNTLGNTRMLLRLEDGT